ncbi:S41 family peptidase [Niabella aurantiaca]|uniref:S41 family peptidase n=1 Tax=Niabella aurantiaca TaxID=379900 RepID=UPI000377E60D|nr:S41 family peptidase [Niabella aurantiaca]
MTGRYRYPPLFFLALLLGAGIGYNLNIRRTAVVTAGDVLNTIGEHYADEVDRSRLEQIALHKILSQLNGRLAVRKQAGSNGPANERPEITVRRMDQQSVYIRLSALSSRSHAVLAEELEVVRAAGAGRLTLDLRGVAGASFEDAIEIADEFLPGDKRIAGIKGANRREKVYRAKRPGLFETGALTVLADSLTGAAGKLLCAALKDWKRATIIGNSIGGAAAMEMQRFELGRYEMTLPTGYYYTPLDERL